MVTSGFTNTGSRVGLPSVWTSIGLGFDVPVSRSGRSSSWELGSVRLSQLRQEDGSLNR